MRTAHWKLQVFFAIALTSASLTAGAANSPSHSYDLTASLTDSLGGPSLVALGGTLIPGTGYVFAANQGLNLSGALANPANYSIKMTFKIDSTSGFVKLIDYHDLTLDSEWYNINGHLQFFSHLEGPHLVFSPGVFANVLVNRNGATGEIQGYVNGVLEVDFIDSAGEGIFNAPNNIMRFFQDDFHTSQSEASGGTATKIEIFDQLITATPGVVSSICSASNPAPISGSTGTQGVLDPANTDPTLGVVWPAGAIRAVIVMDAGEIQFYSSSNGNGGLLGSATLPGASGSPAFADGKLNFITVHLPAGTQVEFVTGLLGLPPPVILLSCQDVILEAGSSMNASPLRAIGQGTAYGTQSMPGGFAAANNLTSLPGISPAGFGPRLGSAPAAGSLYPIVGGSGGNAAVGTGIVGPGGGPGGSALVISAAQRITVNGTISAFGFDGGSFNGTTGVAQGGGGGSVRLAGLLVEGVGTIDTSAGHDSDGVARSPAGPVEVQAFLQDLFTGITSTVPVRGNLPVQAVPSNLPRIDLVRIQATAPVSDQSGFTNIGSLTTADVTLPVPSTSQVSVEVSIATQNVPEGKFLTVRAVGTDGNVSIDNVAVASASAVAHLTLNAGTTYQIVATPSTPIELTGNTRLASNGAAHHDENGLQLAAARLAAENWMRAFGVSAEVASNTDERAPERVLAVVRVP